MKSTILTIILANFLLICSASEKSYHKKYFAYINKAELFITDKEYHNSLVYFDSAFAICKPLAKDLHNSILALIKTGENKNILKDYSYLLAEKGVGSKYFQKGTISAITNEKFWRDLKIFADRAEQESKQRTYTLRKQISRLYEESKKIENTINASKEVSPEGRMSNNSDSITLKLINLMPAGRLFSENELGVALIGDSVLTPFYDYYSIILLSFQVGGEYVQDQLAERIENTLNQTLISSDDAAIFWDTGKEYFRYSTGNFAYLKLVDCQLYKSNFPQRVLFEINQFRNKKNLCTLEEMERKVIFNVQDNEGFIIYPIPINQQVEASFKSSYLSNTQVVISNVKNCK
jgi:hypothetical protein